MKNKKEKRKTKIIPLIIIIIIVILLSFFLYNLFFKYEVCENIDCFVDKLKECKKASFINGKELIFEYTILGKRGEFCEIEIELLKGEMGKKESLKLEREKMLCSIKYGSVEMPGSDISKCTGKLKEGLQEIMINKLHSYIVRNIGKINYDTLEINNTK